VYQRTDSRPMGSVWENGLELAGIYRRCRVYLKLGDHAPPGRHMFIDDRTGEKFMIENGTRVSYKPGDARPAAICVHLGRRGGRCVIDEAKLERLVAAAASESGIPKRRAVSPGKDVADLFG
jgi:hypothetical protein